MRDEYIVVGPVWAYGGPLQKGPRVLRVVRAPASAVAWHTFAVATAIAKEQNAYAREAWARFLAGPHW